MPDYIEEYLCQIKDNRDINQWDTLYTHLDAKEPLLMSVRLQDERGGRDERDVGDVVAQEKRLIISGASGMGKTTTLKWLTLVYAEKCLKSAERWIPLYVDLARFKRGMFYDHALMNARENGLEEGDFKELLDDGKLAIFLDGLDLLGGSEDFEPTIEIRDFMSTFSRCKFVLSARPGFFEGFKSSCKVSELVELDDHKIKGYIHKYLGEGGEADTLINRIVDNRNERLKLLCRNPMMLHLVIVLQKDGKMVDGRAGIYRESVEGIITHYREKGRMLSSNEQHVRDVLKELAFSMQKENTVRLDYGSALDVAGSCTSHKRYMGVSADQVLEDCFGIGLLHKDDNAVRFEFHQSFQEYFAAVKLKEIFEYGYDISESFFHPKWEDTLVFLSEITKRPDELFDDVIGADKAFLAARLAAHVDDHRVENLCARLLDQVDSESDSEKYLVMESFAYIGDRGYEVLMEVPISDWDELFSTFVLAFGRIGDKQVVELLIDMLHNNSNPPTTQYFAILALGEIRAEGAVEPLINLLYGDPVLRGAAARALEKIGDKQAVKPLIDMLNDDDPKVRRCAIHALGAIRDKRAIEPLIDALHGDAEVQDMAAETLGKIGDKMAVKPLIDILQGDGNIGVRQEAILALGEIGDEKAVEPITEALHGYPELRWCATIALGRIRDEKYIEKSIGKMGDEEYIKTLMALLNSDRPEMQQKAIVAITYRCESKYKEKFKPLLRSDRKDVASATSKILHLIELKERGELKIFKELKKKPAPAKTKSGYTTPSGVMGAEEMLADAHLGALIDRLKLVPDSITIVDYGCGKGAFLGRMKEIERELGKIHYIGVDISRGNRYLAGRTAKKYGVADKLKSYDFMNPDEFFSKNINIDHVFFSHVIHEIFLKDLPEILYHLLSKMKAGSRITILEQIMLVEPERDFVTWSADDFDMLFSGFAESSPRPYQTGRGHELISVDLKRLNTDVSLESIRKRCLEVYEHKKERVGKERKSSDLNEDGRWYFSELYANIDSQIIEYRKSIGLDE